MKQIKQNRINKHKDKKSSGCGLCKPHKHGSHAFKDKDRLTSRAIQKVEILEHDSRIDSIAIVPMKNLRGFLKRMDTTIKRDKDRV